MVTCSGVVDGGRWKEELIMATENHYDHQQQQQQQRAMKSARPLVYDVDTGTLRFCKTTSRASLSKSPAHSRSSPLDAAEQEQTVADDDSPAAQHKLLTCGAESGESSPTCVIQNSAVRSNSSSPTLSTISKASSDPGRKSHEQEARRSYSASSSTTTTTKSASLSSPESGSETHKTPPFKSIQSAAADKTLDSGAQKPKKSNPSSSIMHKAPGIFSFNATYVTGVDDDFDDEAAVVRRTTPTFLAPLLKPTPSKWDDAEKWVPGSGKSRSGPLLAQMVASQAGMLAMPIPSWKPHLQKLQARYPGHLDLATSELPHTTATTSAHSHASDFAHSVASNPHVHSVATDPHAHTAATNPHVHTLATDSAHMTTDSTDVIDEKISQFLVDSDGGSSPSRMNGSFMNLGLRMQNSTRDVGTAMTPISSAEPSPLRSDPEGCGGDGLVAHVTAVAMTEEEMVEKTRQEIVSLGTQLGKASIAAAWAAREHAKDQSAVDSKATARSSINCGDVSRADAWKEAEAAKYTFRFQQEEAKIAAWEEHEKSKAEVKMLRVEAKAERMKAQAHEKLANKVAATARQGENLRRAAETRRTEAAAKAARKAELMKRQGKITNLFFLSFLCT